MTLAMLISEGKAHLNHEYPSTSACGYYQQSLRGCTKSPSRPLVSTSPVSQPPSKRKSRSHSQFSVHCDVQFRSDDEGKMKPAPIARNSGSRVASQALFRFSTERARALRQGSVYMSRFSLLYRHRARTVSISKTMVSARQGLEGHT